MFNVYRYQNMDRMLGGHKASSRGVAASVGARAASERAMVADGDMPQMGCSSEVKKVRVFPKTTNERFLDLHELFRRLQKKPSHPRF
jgi:hypothetical protein